jgi:hypothetical protein
MSIAVFENEVRRIAVVDAILGVGADFWIVLGGSLAAIAAAIAFVDPVYARFLAESLL